MTPAFEAPFMAHESGSFVAKLERDKAEREERERVCAAVRGPRPEPAACPECGAPRPAEACAHGLCWREATSCQTCDRVAAERRQRAERIAALGLAPCHAAMTFEAYEPVTDSQRRALERVRAGDSLWLVGLASKDGPGTGTGKSHLSVAACIAAAEAGAVRVEYHVAPELYARLRGEAMSEGMEDTVRDLCECDLLVLDDLDKGRKTPLAAEAIYRIVEERSVNGRRTLVTTNSRPGEVAALFKEGGYGPAIASRLRGLCDVLTVDGPDHRLTAANRSGDPR